MVLTYNAKMQSVDSMESTISCSWCNPYAVTRSLPNVFCWTKMQADAGQSLDTILQRKELERLIGNGVFFWGVGNALGSRVTTLRQRVTTPQVLFSIMRSKPKRQDVEPTALLLWTAYIDGDGNVHPLPRHALILSRATTATGDKLRYYALVCHSDASLTLRSLATLDFAHFRNLGSSNPNIGFSQVTANIEHLECERSGPYYSVGLQAALVPPYFISLTNPCLLSNEDRSAVDSILAATPSQGAWATFVSDLRDRLDKPYRVERVDARSG